MDDSEHAEPMRCWVLNVSLGSGLWWDPLLSLSLKSACVDFISFIEFRELGPVIIYLIMLILK